MSIRLAVVALTLAATVRQAPVTVSAAISLTACLEAIARAYAAGGGGPVRFNFAGSNVLVRQIVSGAPVDVFISADEAQMDVAANANAIDAATRVDLVGNRLVVVTRPDRAGVKDARGLLKADIRRVAIGDPAGVPAGVYAKTYLQAVGMWDAIQPKLVPLGNVRAAIAAVENGSADAAFVYQTDVQSSPRAAVAFVISGPESPRIVYPAALVRSSRNRAEAARFLSFLRGRDAAAIFERFTFVPLERR